MPWKPGHSPLRQHPDYENYLFEQWTHGALDDFWRQLGIWTEGSYQDYSKAACVHMSSWYDPYSLTAATNYLGLIAAAKGPQRLILGPWTHGDRSDSVFGDVSFGDKAPLDHWAGDASAALAHYAAGSDGPAESDALLQSSGRHWKPLL